MLSIKTGNFFPLFIAIIILVCLPLSSHALMNEIPEQELSQISAQAGIRYIIGNSGIRISTDSFWISDTEPEQHWIKFDNITVDDGEGGYFSMDTPLKTGYEYAIDPFHPDFNTIDIATDGLGRTRIILNQSTAVHPRTYTVGNFLFCEQDLGSIRLADVTRGLSDSLVIGSRANGEVGIDMQYWTELNMASLDYTYNTDNGSLNLQGVHLSQYASGSPEDPTAWSFSGKFKFGDMANDSPVTMDVATWNDGISTGTSMFMDVPMSGTMRVENVQFGGNHFGPIAIDGITVHHMNIMMPGN